MKKTILIITALIILTVAVVFAVLWYTNGGESVQPLYLKSSDGAVLTKSITLQKEGQVEYEVKSAGFSRQTEVDEYTIAIQPNLTNDFNYEVGNNRYAFSAAGDLTEYFEITREGNKFTLVTDGTTTISSILTRKHGGEVTLPTLYETESYLNLLIITADNRLTLSVYITISNESTDDITISDGSTEDITISDGSEDEAHYTMTITSSSATLTSSASRGSYYSLSANETYTFNINFYSADSGNLSVTLGGSGNLYFGQRSTNDGGYYNYQNVYEQNINDIVGNFITSATISGTTLTIKTGSKPMENYYSSYTIDEWGYKYALDAYVVELDTYWNIKDSTSTFNNSYAQANATAINSCYFTVTVTDSESGLSQTINLWLDGV